MPKPDIKIEPLNLGGLSGRLLVSDSTSHKKPPILLIYGVHSSLERMRSIGEWLSGYGPVMMPDLPGLGGMDSFYKVGLEPTLDNYADYLYAFLKMKNHSRPLKVVAMSFGFLVVTRMLQKYPKSADQVDSVISFVGFGRAGDFKTYKSGWYLRFSRWLSTPFGSWLARTLVFNPFSLRIMFRLFRLFNPKYQSSMSLNPRASLEMELDLWQKNDARTRFALYVMLLTFDLTHAPNRLDVPLLNITTPRDQYFDPARVEASLKKIYKRVESAPANMKLHAPSIIGDANEVEQIFPAEAKSALGGRQV